MQEIGTPVPYLAMASGNALAIFTPFRVGTYCFGKLPLCFDKPLVAFAVVAWVINLLTSGQGDKVLKTNVNTDSRSSMRRNFNLCFDREAHEPLVAFSPHGNGLDLPTNRAVQLELECTNLRQSELILLPGPTQLWIGEAIVSVIRTEPRKAGLIPTLHTCVKRLESLIHSVKHVLTSCKVWLYTSARSGLT